MKMNALKRSLDRSNGLAVTAYNQALQMKSTGELVFTSSSALPFEGQRSRAVDYESYGLYRGWVYSAVHTLCLEGAGQPVHVARLLDAEPMEEDERRRVSRTKHMVGRMPKGIRAKSIREGFDLVLNHPLVDLLAQPNPVQARWQFTYMFMLQLYLTGWGYLVGGVGENGKMEVYSVPTTWITADHTDGPFSKFRFKHPRDAGEGRELTRDQVAVAYLPDPSNMLGALAPMRAQINAVRIDDHIQTSQEHYFENCLLPSMVLTVGDNPLGQGIPSAGPPLLSGPMRRQIQGAIAKQYEGVRNYGKPLILDALIKSAERLSATQNEMGWDKSEEKAKRRILSPTGVHPFMLGEPMNVGGYSQAAIIEGLTCKRVNTFLDMLSLLMSNTFAPQMSETDRLAVWWEECVPHDPEMRRKQIADGVKNGYVTDDEARAELNLAPLEITEKRSKLLDTPNGMQATVQLFKELGAGFLTSDQAVQLIIEFFQVTEERAKEIVGAGKESIPAVIEQLQTAVEQMKEPVRVEVGAGIVKDSVERTLSASSDAQAAASEAKEEAREALEITAKMHRQLAVQAVKEGMRAEGLSDAVEGMSRQMTAEVESAVVKMELMFLKNQTEDQKTRDIKSVMDELAAKLSDSFGMIDKAVKQPVNIQVHNEVNPTPIKVVNEVNPAEIKIHNEVPETQVDVRNVVETPEVHVQVDAPAVTVEAPKVKVEAPTVNVEAPSVKVEPTIEVQPADVKVEVCKGDAPRRAIITHPDGRESVVVLEE